MGNKYKFEVKVAVDKTTLKVFKTALKILRYVVYVILVLGLSGCANHFGSSPSTVPQSHTGGGYLKQQHGVGKSVRWCPCGTEMKWNGLNTTFGKNLRKGTYLEDEEATPLD